MIHANAILHDKNNRFKIETECEGPTVLANRMLRPNSKHQNF